MISFIDDHRAVYGVEPICRVLPIAPSTYYAHAARRADPEKQPVRARSDAALIHRRGPWRSFEAVEYATLEWVDWYNHRRLLAPIGNVPPAEAEARYHTHVGDQALAA
jgi:transposase InsO family protein